MIYTLPATLLLLQAANLAAQSNMPAQQQTPAQPEQCVAAAAFKPTADAIAALAPDLATQPLMVAMYDFRQAAREALGAALKDRDQLDFKTNAAIFAKDYAVLTQHCAKVAAAHTGPVLSAMYAVQAALKEAAPSASAGRETLTARITALEEELADVDWDKTTGKAKEALARKGMAALKAALDLYKLENNAYPATLAALTTNYISAIPEVSAGGRPSAKFKSIDNDTYLNPCEAATGKGGWLYFADNRSPLWGSVLVNSRAKTSSGKAWCALRPEKDPKAVKRPAPAKPVAPTGQQAQAAKQQTSAAVKTEPGKAAALRKAGYEEFSEEEHSWLQRATLCSDKTLIKFNKMQIVEENGQRSYFIPTAKVNPMDGNDYLMDYLRKYRAGDQSIPPDISPGTFGTGGTVRHKLCNKDGSIWTGE